MPRLRAQGRDAFRARELAPIFDGEAVSINPSIRNKAHECGTHYWIKRGRFVPAFDDVEEQRGDGRRLGCAPAHRGGAHHLGWSRLRQRLHRVAARVRLER